MKTISGRNLGRMLSFSQYQSRAKATAFYPHVMEGGHPEALAYVTLGLVGEAGEFADMLKKTWREEGGFTRLTQERKSKLLDELGDLKWYVTMMCNELGVSEEAVAQWNLEKLAARAEHGTDGWSEDRKYQIMKLHDRHIGTDVDA